MQVSSSSGDSNGPGAGLRSDRGPSRSGASAGSIVWNIAGAVCILAIGVAAFAVYGRKPEVPQDTSRKDQAGIPASVQTAEVRAWNAPFTIRVDGEAATWRVLTVGAEVAGRILQKPESTRSGTYVSQGDMLLEIDPRNYQLEVSAAQARLNQAQEELTAVEIELASTASLLALAQEDVRLQASQLSRLKSLLDRRATSESDVENAIRQELTARNSLQTQQNQLNTLQQQKKTKAAALEVAKVDLERAELDLSRCRIVAPITGRVVDATVEEGDYVKSGDVLVHISDSSRMEVKCSLTADDVAWVWQQRDLPPEKTAIPTSDTNDSAAQEAGESDPFEMPSVPCEVVYDFQGTRTVWKGILWRYEGTGMDRETRMFPCRILVEEPRQMRVEDSQGGTAVSPPSLLSGMYVTVQIPIHSPVPLLQLPAEAIRPGGQVWIVRDQLLQILPVELVQATADSALIRQSGAAVQPGDRVVVSPLAAVTEGMPVREVSE